MSPRDTVVPTEDAAALERLVANAELFQTNTQRFVELLADDYIVVNIAGRRLKGKEQARQAMTEALASALADVRTRHEIEDITFVRPDVALVSCIKHVDDQRGDSMDDVPVTARLTFVTVKVGEAWQIALAQTTPIRT